MNGGGFFGAGFGGGYGVSRRFEEQYHCYSVAYADKSHLEVRKRRCLLWCAVVWGVAWMTTFFPIVQKATVVHLSVSR
jgi:hypothetical protein